MFVHTKFRNHTNTEFLNSIEGIRYHSPIIAELCRRLEKMEDNHIGQVEISECPVCEAKLEIDVDEKTKKYCIDISENS